MTYLTTLFRGRRDQQSVRIHSRAIRKRSQTRPSCETLEGRELLSGVNIDYTLMGGQWNNSQPISFSVAPDRVAWDHGQNDVNAQLDSQFGSASWQKTLATALQTWAASANLNFVPISDGPYAFNAQGQAQGDARYGDIRVAGYAFPTTTIAQTYGPPPNGYSAAGDVKLNTSYNFGPNGQWDLESVLIHELGHSLGLGESPQPDAAMYVYYSGIRQSLSSYDVEGIQSIYGPRQADAFQASGRGLSAASAVDLGPAFNAAGQAVVGNLSLNSIGASEYFAVTAPKTQGGTLQVKVVAAGHSLLSPKVTVIDQVTGQVLASDSHPDQYGSNAVVTIAGTIAGRSYLIVVTGASKDVFAIGSYELQAGFTGGTALSPAPTPVVTPAVPATPIPSAPVPSSPAPTSSVATTTPATPIAPPPVAIDRYAGNNSFGTAAELGTIAGQTIINNVGLTSGQDVRVFSFRPAASGLVFVASANATIVVGDSAGRMVASGRGLVGFSAAQAGARYFVVILSPNNMSVADAGFAIQVVPVAASVVTTPTTPVTVGLQTPTRTATSNARGAKAKKRRR